MHVFPEQMSAQAGAEILDFLDELIRSFQHEYADPIHRGYHFRPPRTNPAHSPALSQIRSKTANP